MTLIRTIEGQAQDYAPRMASDSNGGGRLGVDPGGNLAGRSQILTDEGGYRINFSGNSLYLLTSGNLSFTNGSNIVTGDNISQYNFRNMDYVKLGSDADTYYNQIESHTDTQIVLASPYQGSTATGQASLTVLVPKIGTGGTLTVSNGTAIIDTGTISNVVHELERDVDYLPLVKQSGLAVSQRLPNQYTVIGVYDAVNVVNQYWAWFKLDGTDKNYITCESAYSKTGTPSDYEKETTIVKVPYGLATDVSLRYRLEVSQDRVRFIINGLEVASHYKCIPNPYSKLTSTIRIVAIDTLGSSTQVIVDYDTVLNMNKVTVAPMNELDPAPAKSEDIETLVHLLNTLVSRTGLPDSTGRNRVVVESDSVSNRTVSIAQIAGTTTAANFGTTSGGTMRIAPTYEQLLLQPPYSVINNIVTS